MAGCVIAFELSGRPSRRVRVDAGTSLLDAVRAAGLPLARGCDGGGLCGRCGLTVLAGADRLSRETEQEAEAKRRNRTADGQRLACRSRVSGDVTATAHCW